LINFEQIGNIVQWRTTGCLVKMVRMSSGGARGKDPQPVKVTSRSSSKRKILHDDDASNNGGQRVDDDYSTRRKRRHTSFPMGSRFVKSGSVGLWLKP
jgi:hypothetical protein